MPGQATKRISPVALHALGHALGKVYWYKDDLRRFLTRCLSHSAIVGTLNWNARKWEIAAELVDRLAAREDDFQDDLLRLIDETSRMSDFSHLARLDDGQAKVEAAQAAVASLRKVATEGLEIRSELEAARRRREAKGEEMRETMALKEKLDGLRARYLQLFTTDPRERGYQLESLLAELFEYFDLDPKRSFRNRGEQIDGAFAFEGIDYLLECKWHEDAVGPADLRDFVGKVRGKLENTLGLFVSVSGFSHDAPSVVSGPGSVAILMDGEDLMAVLDGRIGLDGLLLRKRRHAAQTGDVYLRSRDILMG